MFKKVRHTETNFELQITALIDTLVIILIFLLKTISMESLEASAAKGLTAPTVSNGYTTGEGSRLVISREIIQWNSKDCLKTTDVIGKDLRAAQGEWSKLASAIKQSQKETKDETSKEKAAKLFLQADRSIPFYVIQNAIHVARQYGFKDIQFIGAKYN
jgi:biopolymer transport protein ExbD